MGMVCRIVTVDPADRYTALHASVEYGTTLICAESQPLSSNLKTTSADLNETSQYDSRVEIENDIHDSASPVGHHGSSSVLQCGDIRTGHRTTRFFTSHLCHRYGAPGIDATRCRSERAVCVLGAFAVARECRFTRLWAPVQCWFCPLASSRACESMAVGNWSQLGVATRVGHRRAHAFTTIELGWIRVLYTHFGQCHGNARRVRKNVAGLCR